jgi:hypothetical protein
MSETLEPRFARRLSDKVLTAFHHACDQGDIEVAGHLLDVLEFMIHRTPHLPDARERRTKDSLVAAHERLWLLGIQRCRGTEQGGMRVDTVGELEEQRQWMITHSRLKIPTSRWARYGNRGARSRRERFSVGSLFPAVRRRSSIEQAPTTVGNFHSWIRAFDATLKSAGG